ncbi:MAG: CBS domain-containing protein [Anaerolineales bacterium]|jgi:CBS domain-containing protein|nr:CBS domain-containing protein [Anaerolineales bacterium]
MTTVNDLMTSKEKHDTYSIDANGTVYQAIELMANANIGAVLVTEGERIVGIFSERDYARKVILKGHDSRTTQVREIMTGEMVTVHPETSVEKCMALMTQYHIRHLPVVDQGHLIGLISIGDVVHSVVADKQNLISDLQEYIEGLSILR